MDSLAELLKELDERPKKGPCMCLSVCHESGTVEFLTDTGCSTYGEWIKGEGTDICIYREQETKKVVGCCLVLRKENLRIFGVAPEYVDSLPYNEESPVIAVRSKPIENAAQKSINAGLRGCPSCGHEHNRNW